MSTLQQLQVTLPWTVKYSIDFRANPQAHKDFAHALHHIYKAGGKLADIVDDFDHRRETDDLRAKDWLADLVICALRMANTYPGGMIDLQTAVITRLEAKNFPVDNQSLEKPKIGHKNGCVKINCAGCGDDFYSVDHN